MSEIEQRYTSIGCLRKGAAGIGQKAAFVAAAGVHRFNEVYVPPQPSRPGWYQNERGIYVGYGRDEDLQSFRVPAENSISHSVVEGCRGTPAFCPQTLYEENFSRNFSGWIDAKGVFIGNKLHIRVVAKAPMHGPRYPDNEDYFDQIRFVFWINDGTFGGSGFNLYAKGDMAYVAATARGMSLQRQSGLTYPDGYWHTYDVVIYKKASASLFIDGVYSNSAGEDIYNEGPWNGILIVPVIQIYGESRPDASYAVQSCSLEVYDAV